jgi:hypothetical protein
MSGQNDRSGTTGLEPTLYLRNSPEEPTVKALTCTDTRHRRASIVSVWCHRLFGPDGQE